MGVNCVAQLDIRTEGPAVEKKRKAQVRVNVKSPDDAGRNKSWDAGRSRLAAPQPFRGNIIRPIDGRVEKLTVHAGEFKARRVENGDGIVIVLALKILVPGKVGIERKSLQ